MGRICSSEDMCHSCMLCKLGLYNHSGPRSTVQRAECECLGTSSWREGGMRIEDIAGRDRQIGTLNCRLCSGGNVCFVILSAVNFFPSISLLS